MELTLTEAVTGVVVGSMIGVCLLSFISRGHRSQGRARAAARTVVCRLCLHAWQQVERTPVAECPKCGARNLRGHRRPLE